MLPSSHIRRARERRVRLLNVLVGAGLGGVVYGLVGLQVLGHAKYAKLSEENYVRPHVLRAPRGAIYDRNGVLLVDSAPSFNVMFQPFPAESAHRANPLRSPAWIARVADLVARDTADVRRLVGMANASGRAAVLLHAAPFAVRSAVEELKNELPGLDVEVQPMRRYPFGILAAHLLGYAGEIGERELDSLETRGYRPGDLIGRSGVERSFERRLRGEDGAEYVVVNATGRRVATLGEGQRETPLPGSDLVLALDLRVQQAMEEAMASVERGAAVALDPRDGAVLGMVSRPAFDPNDFAAGLSGRQWLELTRDDANPLLNRAIQGLYAPGSTFKIVTMLEALRAGAARPTTRLHPCGGSYTYGGRAFGCWKRTGHGSLDLIGALQHSCNVYFYQIGLRVALPGLEEAARGLGLGERTGIDLPGEKGGLVPGPDWYEKHRGPGRFRKALMLNLAIGQGELRLPPLQIALMAAEVANRGRALRPHVVREVRGERRYRPDRSARQRIDVTAEAWETVREAMERVVSAGTGGAARVAGVPVAGKTGTAQNPHGKDHALFTCFAPVDEPSIALALVVENSGHGGSVAAPLAGRVLTRLFVPDSLRQSLAARQAPPDSADLTDGD